MFTKLVVGLGNPCLDGTPHNLGFMVVARMLENEASHFVARSPERFSWSLWGMICDSLLLPEDSSYAHRRSPRQSPLPVVATLRPMTLMNLSGASVRRALSMYPSLLLQRDVLVIHDDTNLPLGQVKLHAPPLPKASSHNGVKSVVASVGAECSFLRVGCGRRKNVLQPFGREEKESVEIALQRAVEVCMEWVLHAQS